MAKKPGGVVNRQPWFIFEGGVTFPPTIKALFLENPKGRENTCQISSWKTAKTDVNDTVRLVPYCQWSVASPQSSNLRFFLVLEKYLVAVSKETFLSFTQTSGKLKPPSKLLIFVQRNYIKLLLVTRKKVINDHNAKIGRHLISETVHISANLPWKK